jgi:hypothetical protein
MKSSSRRLAIYLGAIGLGLALSAPAFAAKDAIYPSAATATVSSASADVSNNFVAGADGSTTLDEAVFEGQAVVVTATWSVKDNLGPGMANTNWTSPRSVTFNTSTTQKPPTASDVVLASIPSCTLASKSATCTSTISFSAPATPGNYEVQISVPVNNVPNSSTGHLGRILEVNFSVAEPVVLLDTKLTVAKQCFLLNAGDRDLTADLEELISGNDIAGANVDFFIDPPSDSIGSATTDAVGRATLAFNVNGLAVGDHNLYAEYAGDSGYNPSNDSDILGISYLFVGFQPPINPEGNSVFGNGRVIPIKIKLADANGEPVTDASPTVWLNKYSESTGLGEVIEAATSVSAADTGNTMRYDPEAGQYIYNWDLSDLANGTYAVVVEVGDSPACNEGPYYAVITVAKKGKK